MLNQTLDNLAPFQILDENGEPIILVNSEGVTVQVINFPDGSQLTTASGVSNYSSGVDMGTF